MASTQKILTALIVAEEAGDRPEEWVLYLTHNFEIERATYANITFFAPILLGRALMRATRLRPASENNITISSLNGVLGRVLGAESKLLRRLDLPFGVSALCVAKRVD